MHKIYFKFSKQIKSPQAISLLSTLMGMLMLGVFTISFVLVMNNLAKAKNFSEKENTHLNVKNEIIEDIKSTPYKDLEKKYSGENCVPVGSNYCYKPSISFSKDKFYANVSAEIFKTNDTNNPIDSLNVSRAFIKYFSPPQIKVRVFADDHFTGTITKNDLTLGTRYIGSEQYYDNWATLWTFDEILYDDVNVQYVHIQAWNNNRGDWGGCGVKMWLDLDKPFYEFGNKKQHIDSINNQEYFNLGITGWNGNYLPANKRMKNSWHAYGAGTFWRDDSFWGPVYISVPVYLNTSSIEI